MAKKNIFQWSPSETANVYLALQLLVQHGVNHGDLKYAVDTEAMRACLRNSISKDCGATEQEVQEYKNTT